ncbi:MAG: hypothetical protein OM95_01630 [Bdellovibrio sp. ArHS]|nr:MAG: hypothetical protein OM95_01630 [Bdellovibrio sp. ArHS]
MNTVFLFAPPWAQASSLTCGSVFVSDARPFANIEKFEQLYTKGRGLDTYKRAMGPEFSKSVDRVLQKENSHWFDSGAGHAFAVRQALESPTTHATFQATVVAYETSAQSSGRLKVHEGRFLENIADREIPKSDLITDVFGPLAYSGRPDIVLQKYLNNLKPDGEIYLFFGARHEIYGQYNTVLSANGRMMTLTDWIGNIPGLKAELRREQKEDDGTLYEQWTMRIVKERSDVKIPEVEMIHFKEGAPPQMTFKELDNKGVSNLAALEAQARETVRKNGEAVSATTFLNSFRSGEISHPLLSSIKGLKNQEAWLNVTAMGGKVLEQIKAKDFDYSDRSVFVGLSQKFIAWRSKGINPERFSYITGLTTTGANLSQKNIKLITDFQGDFMTSYTPDKVLKRYVDLLADKGTIYIYTGQEYGGFGRRSVVRTKNGQEINLRAWLSTLPGLKGKMRRGGYHWAGGEWSFVEISIKDREAVQIPELKFLGIGEATKDGVAAAYFQEM